MGAPALIRPVTAADAAAVAALYAPYVRDTAISFEAEPPNGAEMVRRIGAVGERYPWLAAERDGCLLGYAYACEHRSRAAYRWDVDVAVYLDAAAHRQGLGRRLYTALFDLLRLQGYVNAYAGIALPNAASVGLHEALGFAPVGVYRRVGYKHGAWHDVGWWALGLLPPPSSPAEPLPWPALDPRTVAGLLEAA
ncbi:MAG: GNAT family N-acetyltransferase [Nevskia sp.]|nr:GNAT family N-acetyltransferase [Nevskia sp.]